MPFLLKKNKISSLEYYDNYESASFKFIKKIEYIPTIQLIWGLFRRHFGKIRNF